MNSSVKNSVASEKPRGSLARNLLLWFLLLSLIPMSLTAWIGYRQAINSLHETVSQELAQDAHSNARFIKTWFDYRFMDIRTQAGDQQTPELLIALQNSFKASNETLKTFTRSAAWRSLADEYQQDLVLFSRQYDYIYNLFLIDNSGNILFTVARENDLGINLFSDRYASTRFASTARRSLESCQTLFSDLEHHAPDGKLAGFITTPIFDVMGRKIGVFAIQLQLDRIHYLVNNNHIDNSLTHYLVGQDGRLRTPLERNNQDEILRLKIDSEQTRLWQQEHGDTSINRDNEHEIVFNYPGPSGKEVVGIHQNVSIGEINWALISEINFDEAFAPAQKLKQIILMIFLLTSIIVTVLAIFQARRITRPITQLVDASKLIASGEISQPVKVDANNEIGVLADALNHMNAARLEQELVMEQSSLEIQEALIDLEEQKFALDQHAIVAITDVTGTINFANDKFTEITGYSRQELLGQNHRLLNSGYHDSDFFKKMYETISAGKVWNGEICNRAKDGRLYWVDTTIVPFMDDDDEPESYIAIRTDITKRKKAEQELVEAKENAEAATLQKSEFLANMSHEIRTPMNGIIGMSGLLLETDLSPKQRSYARATMNSADALLTIINDILDFSKIEAGKLELEEVPFDLQSLVEDVSELMALKCREKGIEMLLRYRPNTERFVIGDPGRVRQILLNLLSNAVKFTQQGDILLTIESIITNTPQTTELAEFRISVADSGIGIAQDKLSHIFNKFDQEDSSTTRKYGGTGLGLAICQQLCTMMRGDITVESQKGKGSTFTFTIKLQISPEPLKEQETCINHHDLSALKTLIVDSSEAARTIFKEQLSPLRLREVSSASSAKEAIDLLQRAVREEDPFNIAIIDSHIPETAGEALAAEIMQRKLLADGTLLFVTSHPGKGDGVRLKSLGVDGYLTKPTYPSEIPQILSLIRDAKLHNREIPLLTRHTLKAARTGSRKKPEFNNTQILLVEDNPVNIDVATEMLEGYHCTVTPAGNGLEALALAKIRDFDLIFMDCLMPEMDGFEATTAIRRFQAADPEHQRTPIIAFTANAMKSDREKCLDAGMDDYISKPVNQEALENILIKWLAHKAEMVEYDSKDEALISPTDRANPLSEALDLTPFNQLKKMFGERFLEIIEQHTQNAAENVSRVEEAIKQGDLEQLEHAAHSIKGASAQFGATQLNKVSIELEKLAKEGNLKRAEIVFRELRVAQQVTAEAMLRETGQEVLTESEAET